jgi:hypothetical protein
MLGALEEAFPRQCPFVGAFFPEDEVDENE